MVGAGPKTVGGLWGEHRLLSYGIPGSDHLAW